MTINQLTHDVIKALHIAEDYLQRNHWVDIRTIRDIVHMNVGTIHSDGFMELPHTIYMIRGGKVLEHRTL